MNSKLMQWLNEPDPSWRRAVLPPMATQDNYVSGEPHGERLRTRYFVNETNQQLVGKVWFGPGTQGPPGYAHGGSIAAALDEVMGGAAWLAGHMAVAAQITISFHEMLPLGTCCVTEARVVRVEGRKVRTEARLRDSEGALYATGAGLFIKLDASKLAQMTGGAKGFAP